ncbi:MAG TPA: TIGR01777 family oxidoreductase [Verrucomicrobiae bacterium]
MNEIKKRIVIAGGSGFIGQALALDLAAKYDVVVLSRMPKARNDGVREVEWDGVHLGEWIALLNGAEAVVNLTGKNINCLHTPENIRELMASRIDSVSAIDAALEHIKEPPRVWVQASATGFYGNSGEVIRDEFSPGGDNILAEICKHWEKTFQEAKAEKTKKILLRVGFVLGRDGGALPVLEQFTRRYLGGRAGSGKQCISWIHMFDLVKMFRYAIEDEKLSGIYNAVGYEPVTNKDFMRELRHILRRPWSPPVPGFIIRLVARRMKSEPSLALEGCHAIPIRFLEAGFEFRFSTLKDALADLYKKP